MIKFKNVIYKNILNNVSFEIEKNKYNVITGENGSGKSTIAKLIIGLMKVNSGEILIDGEKLEYSREKLFEVRKKIGIVFKEIDEQIVGTTVLESLIFGMENNRLSPEKMRENIEKYCEKFGIEHLLERKISELSGGEKQKVAMVSAIVVEPKVLILDEALEMLDEGNKKNVKKFLWEYVKAGNTVISITHNVEEIRYSDKIIFIEKNVENFQEMWKSGKIDVEKDEIKSENIENNTKNIEKKSIIELKNVSYFYNKERKILENLNISIVENEINAVIGKSGAGKTTLIELMSGLLPLNNFSGEIAVNLEKIYRIRKNSTENELTEMRKNMGILFQDVEKQFFESTVFKEIEYNILKKMSVEKCGRKKIEKNTKKNEKNVKNVEKQNKVEKENVEEKIKILINEVGLNENYLEKSPFSLSDGEKKMVGMAMVLATEPKILFLDEPTVNLDFKMTKKIVEILKKLLKKGITVVLITHDKQLLKYATNIVDLDKKF